MEAQLQKLISQIKEDGVVEAKRESTRIIQEARDLAKGIESNAKTRAEELQSISKKEADKYKASSEQAIKQAGRNIVLSLKNEITGLFRSVIREQIESVLTEKAVADIIVKLVETWHKKDAKDKLELLVNETDRNKLEKHLFSALSSKMKQGIEIKPVADIKKGFLIGTKGGNVHYDITDEGITDILVQYLAPKLGRLLKETK